MSEKISEEMRKKIADVIDSSLGTEYTEAFFKALDAAGMLEPEEDTLEKARRLRKEMDHDDSLTHGADIMADAYEAAITRLKASAWTEGDARWYGDYCWQQGRKYNSDIQTPSEWLAQRREGKGAE